MWGCCNQLMGHPRSFDQPRPPTSIPTERPMQAQAATCRSSAWRGTARTPTCTSTAWVTPRSLCHKRLGGRLADRHLRARPFSSGVFGFHQRGWQRLVRPLQCRHVQHLAAGDRNAWEHPAAAQSTAMPRGLWLGPAWLRCCKPKACYCCKVHTADVLPLPKGTCGFYRGSVLALFFFWCAPDPASLMLVCVTS